MEVLEILIIGFSFWKLLYHVKSIRDMLVFGRVLIGTRYKKRRNICLVTNCFLLAFVLWEFYYHCHFGFRPFGFRVHILYVLVAIMAVWDHSLSLYRFVMFTPRGDGYKFYPSIQPVPDDMDDILGDVILREETDGSCVRIIGSIKNSPELRKRMKWRTYVMVRFSNDCFDLEPNAPEKNVELI